LLAKKRTRGKGFQRTSKQWEETISTHIGEVINRGHAVDYLLNIALAYTGYSLTNDWRGLIIGPIALKLASAHNVVAGAAGVAALSYMGLASLSPPKTEQEAIDMGVPPVLAKLGKIADDWLSSIGL